MKCESGRSGCCNKVSKDSISCCKTLFKGYRKTRTLEGKVDKRVGGTVRIAVPQAAWVVVLDHKRIGGRVAAGQGLGRQ